MSSSSDDNKQADDEIWRSKCCGDDGTVISKPCLQWTLQALISLAVLSFCGAQLARGEKENESIYFSLISSILTLHIPAPLLTKD